MRIRAHSGARHCACPRPLWQAAGRSRVEDIAQRLRFEQVRRRVVARLAEDARVGATEPIISSSLTARPRASEARQWAAGACGGAGKACCAANVTSSSMLAADKALDDIMRDT
ncbi:MAG TPA: hypothetical protein VN228_09010 [Pyrinomonadaceae bacterium]|nr:hypothetical protein [Pyrinomonadaceae bacterium]